MTTTMQTPAAIDDDVLMQAVCEDHIRNDCSDDEEDDEQEDDEEEDDEEEDDEEEELDGGEDDEGSEMGESVCGYELERPRKRKRNEDDNDNERLPDSVTYIPPSLLCRIR
jgi:hypothetical protein